MYVIEVIPLQRGSQIESLTYYSSIAYPAGTILDIPLRKQIKRGVVIGHQPVSATKTAVRTATFTLRKLPEQTNITSLPPALMEAAKRLSATTPAALSSLIFALLPPEVREGAAELESNLPCIGEYEQPQVSVLQGTFDERIRTYRSKVREAFAHRGSVLLIVPTSRDIEAVTDVLDTGIENRIVTFSPTYTIKKMAKAYESLHDLSKAKLIIATASHAFIDRHDITNIIIEQSRSRYYKSRVRPYIDTIEGLIFLARATGRHVLLGDLLPRAEDEYKRREDFYLTESETPKRLSLPGSLRLIEQRVDQAASEKFRLFSDELLTTLQDNCKSKKRSFLLAARRGIAPLVTCVDCGHVFRCPDTGAPYSLIKTGSGEEEKRWFVSSAAGKRIPAPDTCSECGSWRLRERGIGIQHIHSELKKELPHTKVVLFDHTTATTPTKALRLISEFYDAKGCVLLGTILALPYLTQPVASSAISSLEALRANPSWRAEEELLALLLRLREVSEESVLIQSRTPADSLIQYAKEGAVEKFYDEELELREQLGYPPFSTFVHLTIQGNPEQLDQLQQTTDGTLAEQKIHWYKAPTIGPKQIRYGLLRIPRQNWPDQELLGQLRQLTPSVRIEVNPERLT